MKILTNARVWLACGEAGVYFASDLWEIAGRVWATYQGERVIVEARNGEWEVV